jgi:hypothetical protein
LLKRQLLRLLRQLLLWLRQLLWLLRWLLLLLRQLLLLLQRLLLRLGLLSPTLFLLPLLGRNRPWRSWRVDLCRRLGGRRLGSRRLGGRDAVVIVRLRRFDSRTLVNGRSRLFRRGKTFFLGSLKNVEIRVILL